MWCAFLFAVALAGCGKPSLDTDANPKLQTAVIAGSLALSTINRCQLEIERTRSTAVPECDAAAQVHAYEEAKSRVPVTAMPALRGLDTDIEVARAEVVADLIRLVVPAAKSAEPTAASGATARYPLAERPQWRAH